MNTTQAGAEAPKVRHFYEKCLIRKTPDEVPHFPDVRHFVRFTLMCARARVTHAHMGCQPAEVPHPPHQTNQ